MRHHQPLCPALTHFYKLLSLRRIQKGNQEHSGPPAAGAGHSGSSGRCSRCCGGQLHSAGTEDGSLERAGEHTEGTDSMNTRSHYHTQGQKGSQWPSLQHRKREKSPKAAYVRKADTWDLYKLCLRFLANGQAQYGYSVVIPFQLNDFQDLGQRVIDPCSKYWENCQTNRNSTVNTTNISPKGTANSGSACSPFSVLLGWAQPPPQAAFSRIWSSRVCIPILGVDMEGLGFVENWVESVENFSLQMESYKEELRVE